ncbi:MAG: radical SAM family heme chaperone HemW, partial [Candidatus Cloacimonetes bacterium]|nr:radical SAM family heme chaperone HemW [Candidatus Cloacimonadota bacterium]
MEKVIQTDPLIEHIYIHIPFCKRKCGYCSFYSQIISKKKKNDFIIFLLEEIKLRKKHFNIQPKTIYFGGGTPSLLSAEELEKILSKFEFSDKCEITLEANPTNINEEYSGELAGTSINRISLGVQSFIDDELKLLGRLHDSKQVYRAYELLRNSGFENISFDLIFGLPNQTIADVVFSPERMIELAPEHISTYCLSLRKDVPLYKKITQIPDDETVSEFYSLIREKLISAGYEQYEISNFSKSGFESKHNLCYWSDKHYLGFGPSAA